MPILLGLMLVVLTQLAWGQESTPFSDLSTASESEADSIPSLNISSDPDLAIYEADLRYRMILQLGAFVIGLGLLHLIQVKLKIPRSYFWFVVGGVILGLVLNSHRPSVNIQNDTVPAETEPTYAPTHAR